MKGRIGNGLPGPRTTSPWSGPEWSASSNAPSRCFPVRGQSESAFRCLPNAYENWAGIPEGFQVVLSYVLTMPATYRRQGSGRVFVVVPAEEGVEEGEEL